MVYIEFLVFIVVLSLFIVWFLWMKLSKKYHNWRYNIKNDRGKIGEDHRQELLKAGRPDPSTKVARTVAGSTETGGFSTGQRDFERRELLSPTTFNVGGEEGNSIGRTGNSSTKPIRNPFRKRN